MEKMNNLENLKNLKKLAQKLSHGLITLSGLDKNDILQILSYSQQFKDGYNPKSLENRIVASLFFEASTRTRLSFETAIQRLGGQVIGFSESSNTSLAAKNESLSDTLEMIAGYADAIVMRHPNDGSAQLAQDLLPVPILNGGDGGHLHPTQTLLDLFSIFETQGGLEGIHLGLMGDLRYSRTIQSLLEMAVMFNMRLSFIADDNFQPSQQQLDWLVANHVDFSMYDNIHTAIAELDVLYITRLQKERFADDNTDVQNLIITKDDLQHAKTNLKILHPLPRNEEIPTYVDDTPFAYYFQQATNGLFVRMALLDLIFSNDSESRASSPNAPIKLANAKQWTCCNARCISHQHQPAFKSITIQGQENVVCYYCEHNATAQHID